MCGRSQFLAVPGIEAHFGPVRVPPDVPGGWGVPPDVPGGWGVPPKMDDMVEEAVPGAVVPGIVRVPVGRVVSSFVWGFFDDGTGHNARVETAPIRPAWRESYTGARLVLPLAAFVEGNAWFRPDAGPALAVAGLYRRTGRGRRATMLTRPADATVAPFHDRMPVILPAALIDPWLAGDDADVLGVPSPPLRVEPIDPAAGRQLTFDEIA